MIVCHRITVVRGAFLVVLFAPDGYLNHMKLYLGQHMRLWYLSHRRQAKAQASLCIRAVSPEPSLFAHISTGVDEGSDQKSDI